MIFFLLILVVLSFDNAPYYGLRIGMKPKTLGKDMVSIIDGLLDHLDGTQYPDINDTSGKGLTLQGIFIQNISLLGIHHPLALYDFSDFKLHGKKLFIKGK